MKIRVKFRKWGCMKFIGHLDMMRYFQKAVRRADIASGAHLYVDISVDILYRMYVFLMLIIIS